MLTIHDNCHNLHELKVSLVSTFANIVYRPIENCQSQGGFIQQRLTVKYGFRKSFG